MLFERIVCGVDGSPASLEALRQAAIIRPPDGRLVAVIVSDAFVHAEAETSREAALLEIGDVPLAEAQIVEGRPIPSLLAIAGRERASLLAVGTHGGSRVAGILLGSVATAMLHDAPCPVLIARPAREDSWYPRSIVVGAHPAAILVEETANADLLVGSRGLGGFRGLLLRSVSQQCAEHAGCVILRAESARHMTDSVET